MKPFRFKAKDFPIHTLNCTDLELIKGYVTECANGLLEAQEAKCERLYADCRPVHRDWGDEVEYPVSVRGKFTITALLWNLQPIGELEK